MPLTKQYLRYTPSGTFNIISSPLSNTAWTTLNGQDGRYFASGASEDIIIWDLQLGEKSAVLPGEKTEVTVLCSSPSKRFIAAGFRDGSVRTYDLTSGENVALFSGHKSSITSLAYDSIGHRLSSASKDTHIVVWDIVSESGIARLSSHTNPVTQVAFMQTYNILISSSEDTSIKFWDLDTNYCFKTLMGHRTEVWSFVLMRDSEFLVAGSGDSELRVWSLIDAKVSTIQVENRDKEDIDDSDDSLSPIKCIKMGSILRAGTGKVSRITVESGGRILAVHGAAEFVELFQFNDNMEAMRRLRKRKKKERKKSGDEGAIQIEDNTPPTLQDIVKRLPVVKTKGKIKSCDLIMGKANELRVLLALNNNTVEAWSLNPEASSEDGAPRCLRRIAQQGHHSEIRTLAFSSDNLAMASGSADAIKIWNRTSLACLRTVTCGYVLSLIFAPGDRYLVAGMKDGKLIIVDVNVGEVLDEIPAHSTEVWSVCLLPNQRGCISGGGDNSVQFWDFDLLEDRKKTGKILSLTHRKTLTLEDPVLCVRVTPDSKLLAVALLDMTIKVFFMDTMKFFLSLYGHKLPVVSMDISHDSTLLVSGSTDRNIKLWGLDFGDCHKSIFAHDAAITSVQFVPNTHYFFSCGKDGRIKQWDADNYQKIITIRGHFGEAWTLSISPNGEHVVSSGSDRVLRLVSRSDEPLVLEDEQEEERAQLEEEELVTGPDTTVKGQADLKLPSRKTVSSEKGAEQLLECLDLSKSYRQDLDAWEQSGRKGQQPTAPQLMLAYNTPDVDDYLIETIKRIRASDLEEALVLLPFSSACDLLNSFPSLLNKKREVELIVRTVTFLVKVHHGPIVGSKDLVHLLSTIQKLAMTRMTELRDMVGYNLHGLQYIQRDIEQREGVQLFRDATIERKQKAKKKKRKERALKRAILAL